MHVKEENYRERQLSERPPVGARVWGAPSHGLEPSLGVRWGKGGKSVTETEIAGGCEWKIK